MNAAGAESSWPSGSSKGPGIPFRAVLPLLAIDCFTFSSSSSQEGVETLNLSRATSGLGNIQNYLLSLTAPPHNSDNTTGKPTSKAAANNPSSGYLPELESVYLVTT